MSDYLVVLLLAVIVGLLSFFLFEYTSKALPTQHYVNYEDFYLEPDEEIFHRNNKLLNNEEWRDL